jgi:AcrR family transcriptional regulator
MSKKKDIIDAAISLFAQNGFAATPTTAIAKKAGVAQGLIFHYFITKEGILAETIDQLADKYISETEKIIGNSDNGLEAIINIIQFHFIFESENATELMVLLRDVPPVINSRTIAASNTLYNRIDRTIEQLLDCIKMGQEDGSIRKNASSESAFIIRALLNGLSRLHFSMPNKPDYRAIIFETIKFCRKNLEA